ncbi:MAG: VPLPA-CTERM sorting domain-containing protein, partial [Pseudomonadota bacterium]
AALSAFASSSNAATLSSITPGLGTKLFTTEVKRDQNVNNNAQRGDDVFLRNGDVFQGPSFNVNWGASGTEYDWSLDYDGENATFTFDGVSRMIDVMPDGNLNALQFFVQARDLTRFATSTTSVFVDLVNGMATSESIVATDETKEMAFLANETITSVSGRVSFLFEIADGATGSPNSRLGFSTKALDVAPVPLPAGLPLLLAGLGGLALLRKRYSK